MVGRRQVIIIVMIIVSMEVPIIMDNIISDVARSS